MERLWQDLRQAARTLAHGRGLTCIALLTLSIGTGAVATMYSVLDAALLRPLPFPHGDRLVVLDGAYTPPPPGTPKIALDLTDWGAMRGTFDGVGAYVTGALNLVTPMGATRITAAQVTPTLFNLLGAHASIGRSFTIMEGTPGHEDVVVLSDGFWHRQFGAAANILGHVITLENQPFVVVGVMPNGFSFPQQSDVWLPYAMPELPGHMPFVHGGMTAVARLRAGRSIGEAQAAVSHAEQLFAETHRQPAWVNHVGIVSLHTLLVGDARAKYRVLIGAAALMLLLACGNVAGLLLARAEARQHEIAVRIALGATPSRLVRQLVTEGSVLATVGACGGLLVAWGLRPLVSSLVPQGLAGISSVTLGWNVVGVAVLSGGGSALLFCLAPALATTRADVHAVLRSSSSRGSTGATHVWQRLLVGQVGLTVVMVVAAGLLLKSLWLLDRVDPGFQAAGMLAVNVALPRSTYATRPQRAAYARATLDRLRVLPGMTAAGMVSTLPLSGHFMAIPYDVVGRLPQSNQADPPMAQYFVVSSGYFAALRIPIIAGRAFSDADGATRAPVMVIDQSLAKRIGPAYSAIGERIRMPWDSVYEIVGIVRTVRGRSLDGRREWSGQFYLPTYIDAPTSMTFVVRGPLDDPRFVQAVRSTIGSVDPTIPTYAVETMEQITHDSLSQQRIVALLLTIGGAFALVLAIVGIFGVTAAGVVARTREIGIRMALGASRIRIGREVLQNALLIVSGGIAIGLLGAWAAARMLSHLLYEVAALDAAVFVTAALCIVAAAMVAASVPVWRATRVDPVATLHGD